MEPSRQKTTQSKDMIHSTFPQTHAELFASNAEVISGEEFSEKIARLLSEAVKIPTEVGDEMGHVGDDPRWDIFYNFSTFLRENYRQVFQHLEYTVVNEHGHLFIWQGSDSTLKPLLLMAHSDVVPSTTGTNGQWTYPPYAGHYDGEYIWGRGSEDDKSNLVAILSVFTLLLERKFKPARTIIFAIGFDEEGGAERSYGARCLAQVVMQLYGKGGIELIYDEGMAGIETTYGKEMAYPATSEKGYLDVFVRVDTPGGLTQAPPVHTGIGLLAQAVKIIEDNPFPPVVSLDNPAVVALKKAALFCEDAPAALRSAFQDEQFLDKVLSFMVESSDLRALIQTTTAVTVVQGGDKSNSLPETCYFVVNHRIAPHDSVRVVKDRYVSLLSPWSKKHDLSMHAFGETILDPPDSAGTLTLRSAYDLDPSPISNPGDPRFDLLAGTIRAIFGQDVLVSPTVLLGNTDTRYYWGLTDQIYRMSPWRQRHDPRGTRMHTVDERMPIAGLVEMAQFYNAFILNVDEFRS